MAAIIIPPRTVEEGLIMVGVLAVLVPLFMFLGWLKFRDEKPKN